MENQDITSDEAIAILLANEEAESKSIQWLKNHQHLIDDSLNTRENDRDEWLIYNKHKKYRKNQHLGTENQYDKEDFWNPDIANSTAFPIIEASKHDRNKGFKVEANKAPPNMNQILKNNGKTNISDKPNIREENKSVNENNMDSNKYREHSDYSYQEHARNRLNS